MDPNDTIDDAMNRLSDLDATFWPLVDLRPAPEEAMTPGLVALMALVFGGGAGVACNFLIWATRGRPPHEVLALPLGISAAFFVVYWFTFARAWNRRAKRLG